MCLPGGKGRELRSHTSLLPLMALQGNKYNPADGGACVANDAWPALSAKGSSFKLGPPG